MTQIVECIPNFSEARRPEVVEQIIAAIQTVPEARMLDRSSDNDHNRTVLTFAGPPAAVEEAAFRAIRQASALIDLNEHTGEHPRIGATDVVPFVPISGISMDECVAMAKRLGERVANELNIPVYLYEYAATRPERANLETIRKGQFEGLKTAIVSDPNRAPDFGPAQLGPAGATVIGARDPLIAFNVYLTTDDVSIADKIAKTVRHSSGGLRFVKGMGVLVDGRAQVSMNLTNFRKTPIARVVEYIRREAARYGVAVHHSELVGLIPQDALTDAAVWYTQLDQFTPEQILEKRLYAAADDGRQTVDGGTSSSFTFQPSSFLDDVAAATAAPGGGSAAAYSAALAAGLVSMVAGLTIGKKKYAEIEPEMKEIRQQAESLRAELTAAIDADARAFEAVMAAFKLSKDDEPVRLAAIETATLHAADVPLMVARQAVEIMTLAERCATVGNLNAISDAASAVSIARAALISAGYNVRINVDSLQKKATGEGLVLEVDGLEARAQLINRQLRHLLRERAGLKLE